MWDLIVSVPDHCLSFYFAIVLAQIKNHCVDLEMVLLLVCVFYF